ncbi:MAG TPA: hypothetical protein VD789_13470 [Thermomicrobiales bacterium]|nr:hypothetical protein [Thermomicrobiales bacterium]
MPNEFTVVGENRDDESQLLVVGTDGLYYGYQPAREHFSPVEPDESWTLYATVDDVLAEVASDVPTPAPIPRAAGLEG